MSIPVHSPIPSSMGSQTGRPQHLPHAMRAATSTEFAPALKAAPTPQTAAEESFSFFDLLDVINPLQHLPIIGNLYRQITGDEMGAFARIAGGTLFGGPVGAVSAMVNTAIETETGKDAGALVMGYLNGQEAVGQPARRRVTVREAKTTLRSAPFNASKTRLHNYNQPLPEATAAPQAIVESTGANRAPASVITSNTNMTPLPPQGQIATAAQTAAKAYQQAAPTSPELNWQDLDLPNGGFF